MKQRRTWLTAGIAALMVLTGCTAGQLPATETAITSTAAVTAAAVSGSLSVTIYKAGSADAILIETEEGAVVIDTGESSFGDNLVSALQVSGISEIKALILTHFDADHIGGAAQLISSIQVDAVYQSDWPKDSEEYSSYQSALKEADLTAVTVRDGTSFSVGDASFYIDPPQQISYSENPSNNSSLIIELTYGETRFLFAGDAMDQRIAEYLQEDRGTFQFLKVPYHGRWQDCLSDLFTAVQPQAAVLTAGKNESTEKTIAALQAVGAEAWQTSNGTVHISSDGSQLSVAQD